ncbi:MAG: NUDIX domain-containing protein [Bacilli bacterium]|nr:NUDIX domain-containing protein [Bacilli bacterium]
MINKELKKYIEDTIKPQYINNNYGGHGWEHIQDVIYRSFELMGYFNLKINPNMVYVVAAYHDIGYRQDPDNHEQVSSEMFMQDEEMKKYFNEEERKIIAEAIVDHRASLEYEARSVYGKLVSSADRAIDVDNMLRRSIAFQAEKHKNENPTIEEIIEYSFKKLSSKYGNGGYAKMYFQDAKYEVFLERMNELFSDKNEFIKAELSLISKDTSLKKYFGKEVSKKPEREKFLSSIYLIIKNENGEVLLQRRQGTKLWPGYLALPAGHIDEGENAYEAAIREAKEELGIEIQVEDIIDTFVANRKNKSLPPYYDVYFEISKYLGEIRIAEPEKCSELVWSNPANLPEDMIDFEKEAMENNANGIKFSVTYADNEKKLIKTKK